MWGKYLNNVPFNGVCNFPTYFKITSVLIGSSYLVQGQTAASVCHPAAAPGLYKAKCHHYDYTTPPPSADVPSEPLVT